VNTCRSCGAEILWAVTDSGKAMPVDREPVLGGKLALDWSGGGDPKVTVVSPSSYRYGHRAHFATCPDAMAWRK
jgi:hypothetical protein